MRLVDLSWSIHPLSLPVEHSQRQLLSIQLCPALPPPSSSSCTWNPPSTFHFRAPVFSFALFLCGLVLPTAVLAWQWCHHSFWRVTKSHVPLLFSWTNTGSWSLFFHNSLLDFCLASRCPRFFYRRYSQNLQPACIVFSVTVKDSDAYRMAQLKLG